MNFDNKSRTALIVSLALMANNRERRGIATKKANLDAFDIDYFVGSFDFADEIEKMRLRLVCAKAWEWGRAKPKRKKYSNMERKEDL